MTSAAILRGQLDDAVDHGGGAAPPGARRRRLSESSRNVPATTTRSPGARPLTICDAIAEAPAGLDLARLERAVGAFDEDALAAARRRSPRRPVPRWRRQRDRELHVNEQVRTKQRAGVLDVEPDAHGLAGRILLRRHGAADRPRNTVDPPGSVMSAAAPGWMCSASPRRHVGEDPDLPQVRNPEHLLADRDPARRQAARKHEARRRRRDANRRRHEPRPLDVFDLRLRHAERDQAIRGLPDAAVDNNTN